MCGKFGPKKSKLFVLSKIWHTWHLEDADSYFNICFLNFELTIQFWPNLGEKSQICQFCLKIGTLGILRMWILIARLVFWILKPKSCQITGHHHGCSPCSKCEYLLYNKISVYMLIIAYMLNGCALRKSLYVVFILFQGFGWSKTFLIIRILIATIIPFTQRSFVDWFSFLLLATIKI